MTDDQQWAPARIWLQREQGDHGSHTWCEDSVGDGDIIEEAEYVRVDANQPKALSQHHRDVLGRLEMLLEACQVENGIDNERSKTYAEALRALLEAK